MIQMLLGAMAICIVLMAYILMIQVKIAVELRKIIEIQDGHIQKLLDPEYRKTLDKNLGKC